MGALGHSVGGIILLILLGGFAVWLAVRSFKRAEDPARLAFKWILTGGIVAFMVLKVAPMSDPREHGTGAFDGICLTLLCGLGLAFTWRHNIGSIIGKPFGSLYDGGDEQVDPKPLYSIANSKRKLGKYHEAVTEIWKQLEKFPNDFEGQLLLAEIQAEDMKDLASADTTLQRLCNQPGHEPRNIAHALNSLADWRLKFLQDPEAARQALEQIIELLPATEFASRAAQRVAHLPTAESLTASHDRKKFQVVEGVQNMGLLDPQFHPKPAAIDPAKQASELVEHLQLHPLDTDARERLAMIYADHYQRLEMAADQLEELIALPNQPPKRVAHWLNLLADLQVRFSADYDTVRATLQRIVDLFPDTAAGQIAIKRIEHLKLELKGKQKSADVKLGTYEQDIGLKGKFKS